MLSSHHRSFCLHTRKVLQQQSMNENIPSTHLAQQNMLSRIIEKAHIVERDAPGAPEQATQHKMLHKCRPATVQPNGQCRNGPIYQPPKQGMQRPELLQCVWRKPKEMAHDAHC